MSDDPGPRPTCRGDIARRRARSPRTARPASEFVHAPLLPKLVDGGAHVAARQLLDDVLQGGVLLPHDVVQADRLDAGLLELLIRAAGLDGLMLADVADEQDAIVGTEPVQEVVHLLRAREARLVEHVEARGAIPRVDRLGEMALQRAATGCRRRRVCARRARWARNPSTR